MISSAQFGKDEHGGDLPEEEQNDNGYGTKTVYPSLSCPVCPASFWNAKNRDAHVKERHNNGQLPLFE